MSVTPSSSPARPNLVLQNQRQQRGWGRLRLAKEFERLARKEGLPLAAATDSIVKQIYRVEAGYIAIPEPMYQRLWSKALGVDAIELFGELEPQYDETIPRYEITSDKFVPAYINPVRCAELEVELRKVDGAWIDCQAVAREYPGGECTLYVFPFGVAVLHIREHLEFANIASLAVWRRQTQKDARAWGTEEYQTLTGCNDVAAPYVLSTYWLDKPIWSGADLDNALKLISVPSVLLDRDPDAISPDMRESLLGSAELVERSLMREEFAHSDLVDFGAKGISYGYASWSGVSYFPLAPKRALSREDLVSCETVMQAVWCYCHHILDQVEHGNDPVIPKEFGWRFLRAVKSRLGAEKPRETSQHRMMRLAVLQSSGLTRQLESALEVLREGVTYEI